MNITIAKNQITNKAAVVLDRTTIENYTNKLSVQLEVLGNEAVEVFLTTVGIETGRLDETRAKMMARKVINSMRPGVLSVKFGYQENVWTRPELNEMYLDCLVNHCGVNWFTALGSIEDDLLWNTFYFCGTRHTCEVIRDLPKLTGSSKARQIARFVQHRQVLELWILRDLINGLINEPDMCLSENNNSGLAKTEVTAHLTDAERHITSVIQNISKIESAQEWLDNQHIKYDINWLKKEKNLGFINPQSIEVTPSFKQQLEMQRALLFSLDF